MGEGRRIHVISVLPGLDLIFAQSYSAMSLDPDPPGSPASPPPLLPPDPGPAPPPVPEPAPVPLPVPMPPPSPGPGAKSPALPPGRPIGAGTAAVSTTGPTTVGGMGSEGIEMLDGFGRTIGDEGRYLVERRLRRDEDRFDRCRLRRFL